MCWSPYQVGSQVLVDVGRRTSSDIKGLFFFPLAVPGKKNKLRVYYLSWLRNRILHNDPEVEKKQGWITVGDLEGCVHYKVGEHLNLCVHSCVYGRFRTDLSHVTLFSLSLSELPSIHHKWMIFVVFLRNVSIKFKFSKWLCVFNVSSKI